MRVGNEVANFFLRVKHPLRSRLRQLGKLLALRAETLVIGKMPVQHVHLHRCHTVDVALQHVDGNEVPAHIDQQAPPRKARLIFDGDRRRGKSRGSNLHQLQKCLQAAQNAERRRRREFRS